VSIGDDAYLRLKDLAQYAGLSVRALRSVCLLKSRNEIRAFISKLCLLKRQNADTAFPPKLWLSKSRAAKDFARAQ